MQVDKHFATLPLPCIIVNANKRIVKMGEVWEQCYRLPPSLPLLTSLHPTFSPTYLPPSLSPSLPPSHLGSLITTWLSALDAGSAHTMIIPLSSQLASWPWSLVARSHTATKCPCSCLVNTTSGSAPIGGTLRTSIGPSEVPWRRERVWRGRGGSSQFTHQLTSTAHYQETYKATSRW